MTTLAIGSSATLSVGDGGTVSVATNGGMASASVTSGGVTTPYSIGPEPTRRTFGPFAEGATVVLTNSTCGEFDCDSSDQFTSAEVAAVRALVSEDGSSILPSPEYLAHFYAPLAIDSDTKALDISGALGDGTFQANLAASAAWATAGFLTQANPTGVGQLTMVEFPAISWDWAAGDSLFVFWAGRMTPEGSDTVFLGDTTGASAGNGIRIVCSSTGKLKANAYQQSGTLSRFGGTGTTTVFEASVTHSLAVCFHPDGLAYWSDGARDATYASGYLMPSGGAVSTINTATLKLGGDGGTSGSIQNGPAMQTRALVVLKGRRSAPPTIADLDALVAALRRNPAALVSAASW